ncbi:MAG: hypothetical protein ACE5E1_08590 [Phycisphaerae bacterium]
MPQQDGRIVSGPTTERKVRTLLMLLLFSGMGAYFVYDGWVGYPAKNFAEHLEALPATERSRAKDAPVYPAVRQDSLRAASRAIAKIGIKQQRQALADLYGGPPSFEDQEAWYYFGPDFRVKIPLKNGRPAQPKGIATEKRETDIRLQKQLGVGLMLFSLGLFIHLIRVIRTRLVLDDDGLTYGRRRPIKWDAMRSLDTRAFTKKGRLDLIFDDNGDRRRVRLDEYHLARFEEVLARICDRKGFENPIELERAAKQAASA